MIRTPREALEGEISIMEDEERARRYIPADIRRQVLVECGHACAIPTCRYPATEFAHIELFVRVQSHAVDNIVGLCPNHHTQYDQEKKIDKKAMLLYKQKLQFLNKRYTKYELRVLSVLAEKTIKIVTDELQLDAILREGLVKKAEVIMSHSIVYTAEDGTEYSEDFDDAFVVVLTDKGKQFISTWHSPTAEDFFSDL